MEKNQSDALNKETDRGEVTDAPTLMEMIRRLVVQPLGSLPAPLVVIMAISLVMASVTALILLKYSPETVPHQFMPERLVPLQEVNKIDPAMLPGIWSVDSADFAMTITLTKGKFEWIIMMKNDKTARYFVRGNYRADGDVMILGARTDMGEPSDPVPMGRTYMPLDLKDINFRASVDKKQMIWHVPVSEQNAYASRLVTIFDHKNQADFIWNKLQ